MDTIGHQAVVAIIITREMVVTRVIVTVAMVKVAGEEG